MSLTLGIVRLMVLSAYFLGSLARAENCPAEVHIGFPNFEVVPFIYGTDSLASKPGLLVDWTFDALARSGCKPKVTILRRPAKREMVEMQAGAIDIGPGVGFSPERLQDMAFPMVNGVSNPALVIIRDQVSLYVREGDQSVKWDGKTLQSVNPRVGISAGVLLSQVVTENHHWQVDIASDPLNNIKKLRANRIDVIVEADVLVSHYLSDKDAQDIRKLSPPALVVDRYAPVSKQFQEKYPEFTRRFWLEICKASRVTFTSLPTCRL
jgi:hypothetical protein